MKGRRRIVLADASLECLTLMQAVLLDAGGYAVRLCRSGEEALQAVWQIRPDLMVMDAVLPGIGGVEVLRQLREMDRPPAVLCLSSALSRPLQEEICRLGAAFLQKPVTPQMLLQQLQELSRSAGTGPARQEDSPG